MKRIIALLVTIALLTACIPAIAEPTPPEMDLAQTAIEAMAYTIENMTSTVNILAKLLEENTMVATRFADNTLSNFGAQISEMYNKLQYEAYLKAAEEQMKAFGKMNDIAELLDKITKQPNESALDNLYDIITNLPKDDNGNTSTEDFAKDLADLFKQLKTNEDDIIDDASANTINAFINDVFKDADGNETLPPKPNTKPIVGGWTITTDPTITDAMLNMVTTATANMSDVAIEPIACIGTQLVAGENFCYFCKLDHQGEPGDEYTRYILLYIYVDLNGNAEVIGWAPLNPGIIAGMTE